MQFFRPYQALGKAAPNHLHSAKASLLNRLVFTPRRMLLDLQPEKAAFTAAE
jgi:hypothetical protein